MEAAGALVMVAGAGLGSDGDGAQERRGGTAGVDDVELGLGARLDPGVGGALSGVN